MAIAMIRSSSSPSLPSSPACGLRPVTAMRGRAIPKSRVSERFRICAGLNDAALR